MLPSMSVIRRAGAPGETRPGFHGFARKLAARLLAQDCAQPGERLSRNRHFELFSDGAGRLALRIFRHLRSIRKDILGSAASPVLVERGVGGDENRVRLRIAIGGGVRTAYLSADELDLLLSTPGIRGRLYG